MTWEQRYSVPRDFKYLGFRLLKVTACGACRPVSRAAAAAKATAVSRIGAHRAQGLGDRGKSSCSAIDLKVTAAREFSPFFNSILKVGLTTAADSPDRAESAGHPPMGHSRRRASACNILRGFLNPKAVNPNRKATGQSARGTHPRCVHDGGLQHVALHFRTAAAAAAAGGRCPLLRSRPGGRLLQHRDRLCRGRLLYASNPASKNLSTDP